MSNNRNSVQHLKTSEDQRKPDQVNNDTKYQDKSVLSRGKSIYLGFIDQTQKDPIMSKKKRQSSMHNLSKLSSSSSK